MAGQRDRFLADAFHEAAVACEHIGVVVLQVRAELVRQLLFGECHADSRGNALAERAGGGFDAGGMTIFRVACGLGAELAEGLDVFDRHVLISGEIEERVDQHGAVAGRQHETVAVRPERVLRVEAQVAGEENGRDIGAAHGHAGVAGIGLFHCIHGEETDRIRHPLMFFGRNHGLSACSGASRYGPPGRAA